MNTETNKARKFYEVRVNIFNQNFSLTKGEEPVARN